eukprot:COSAG06_NODE_167_length_21546_cov_35.001352_40_plen_120_part_00
MIIFIHKWLKKTVFLPAAGRSPANTKRRTKRTKTSLESSITSHFGVVPSLYWQMMIPFSYCFVLFGFVLLRTEDLRASLSAFATRISSASMSPSRIAVLRKNNAAPVFLKFYFVPSLSW